MSSSKQRRAPWQNAERHYCAVCNAWMGSDRQSIMLHENGKKHQQNVERALKEKRALQTQEDKANKFLADSLRQMEAAALQATGMSSSRPQTHQQPFPPATLSRPPGPPPPPPRPEQPKASNNNKKQLEEWNEKKRQREEERKKKKDGEDEDDETSKLALPKRRKIAPDEGHYEIVNDDKLVFLEGQVFHGVLESDMPVQLWTGSNLATAQEKRLSSNHMYWKNALVVSVRTPKTATTNSDDSDLAPPPPPIVSIAYLASADATEETIEKNVALDRIRIQLGGDDSIPKTLEEARLLAMGGEIIEQADDNQAPQEVDEATGLSGWSTVTVKKTTTRQVDREEKERAQERLRAAKLEKETERKKAEERKLEEAKVSNTDDSALGAYDIFGKGGYKGVDISTDVKLSAEETAKKLATGSSGVAFRKAKKKKKQSGRRQTLADEDD